MCCYVIAIVHALVTSRIDCCNSLLYGLPRTQLSRLQRVQNTVARLICNLSHFDHISPVLFELHWLPLQYRIIFKVLMITYKTINSMAPKYITEISPWSSHIGSCVLKADSRLIYRPILSQYDGRDSGDISTDMNRHACWLTPGRYFAATRPTLRSFGQLLLLSSIFSIQLLNNLF